MSEYNGHESWEHWNVALWLYNDEYLYHQVKFAVHQSLTIDQAVVSILDDLKVCGITHTPDGAEYTEETVKAAIEEEFE